MLAASSATSTGTWIAIVTLVVTMIPIYVITLKGAQGYGRLEQKVDSLALQQAASSLENAATAKLLAETMAKLTSEFQAHAVQDAGHFGELRGMMTPKAIASPVV